MRGNPNSLVAFCWYGSDETPSLSLPQQIAIAWGDRIGTGAIAPGTRILETELAAEFGVSRGPVREALRILEHEGLVRIQPRHGAITTLLSGDEVRNIFEIRASLYRLVAERLAAARSSQAIAQIEEALPRLREYSANADDGDRYTYAIFRLSLENPRVSGNERLAEMITSLALQTFRYSRLGLHSAKRRQQSLANWEASLVALKRGHAAAAGKLAVARIEQARDEALRVLQQEQKSRGPGGKAMGRRRTVRPAGRSHLMLRQGM